jgi:mRNA interferase MazF
MPGKCVRGAVIEVNLDPTQGHELKKKRPCVVIQNDIGNKFSYTIIVAGITDAEHVKQPYPVNVFVPKGEGGLSKDSVVVCSQIRSVDESRITATLGRLSKDTMLKIDNALRVSLSL